MGGGYYDRSVIQTSSSNRYSYSRASDTVLRKTRKLHKSLDPKRWKTKKIVSKHKNPIVFAQDVTGSMGNWAKVIYDKLPMMYGQMKIHGYLEEPAISFCGIGDALTDEAPFQITEFGEGKQIDQLISKMYLEGFGGGNDYESYDLGAYFVTERVDITKCTLPFFFFTGDENFYPTIKKEHVEKVLGMRISGDVKSLPVFAKLKKQFQGNVFLLHKRFKDGNLTDEQVVADWTKALDSDHIIVMEDAKAVVDIMLGIISLVSGARDLDGYCMDMKHRQQDDARIKLVRAALVGLAKITKVKKDFTFHHGGKKGDDGDEVKTIEAVSYGVIPCRFREGKKCEMFLAKHAMGGHWDFVKGRANEGEDGKTAAARELKEESNLTIKRYLSSEVFKTSYEIKKWEGYHINKKVVWYVAEVEGEVKTQEGEVLESGWFEVPDGVCERLSYENSKELLKKVLPVIEEALK